MQEIKNYIWEMIALQVKGGFDERDQILEYAYDAALDEFGDKYDDDLIEQLATETVNEALAAHFKEQQTWNSPTDCDRLDRVFEALDQAGITARQYYSCCQNCGTSEIWGERPDARGYVFYHQQSVDGVIEYRSLCLYYGASSGEEHDIAVIGTEIAEALRQAGFTVEWNGSPKKAITIENLVWKRRRT